MEINIDVMKQILALTETLEEGLTHIRNRVNDGFFEASTSLISDVLSAFASIEESLLSSVGNVQRAEVEEVFNRLREGFNVLTDAYEQGSGGKALEILQFNVLPASKKWKATLEETFRPYLVS